MYKFNLMIPKELSSVENANSSNSSNTGVNPMVAVRNRHDALAESSPRQDDAW